MDKNFCRQIDRESLVEEYIAGKLKGKLLEKFELHLKDCENHAQAVLLEKAMKRGITDFARGELKSNLRNRLKKREDTRFLILRYAAILLVAVITPLLLYYQLNITPDEMAGSETEREENVITEETAGDETEALTEPEESPESEPGAEISASGRREEIIVQKSTPETAGSEDIKIPENSQLSQGAGRIESAKQQVSESRQDILKSLQTSPRPQSPTENQLEDVTQPPAALSTVSDSGVYISDNMSNSLLIEIDKKFRVDSLSIKRCIESFIDVSERQKFLLRLNIQVLNDGNIGEIKIINSTIKSTRLETCLFDVIRAWQLSDRFGPGFVERSIRY